MLRLNNVLFLFLGCLLSISTFSQTKDELKKQKADIEKEISYTTELLSKTKKNKTKSLNYLKVLDSQIKSKEQLLITLHIEITLINKQIKKTERLIIHIEETILKKAENLQKLKNEYAKMIYAAFKQKGGRNDLMFIISSDDFNQAYKRIIYLKQYTAFRKNQSKKIIESQQELTIKKEKLAQEKERLIEDSETKGYLVSTKKDELKSINSAKEEKERLVKKLSKSERLFKKKIQDKQKKSKELDVKLRKIIEEEIRKAREEAKKRNGDDSFGLTPEALALSSEFNQNKGKLPWPLEKGIIVEQYGKQKHAVFSSVETFNNGIDIATDKNSVVRVVFDGSISRIFFIKGEGKAILVNHGEYFTVYSGLKEVAVKVGDKVLSKQKLGVVLTQEAENKTELHFEIWMGYDKKDPSKWLYKAY